ncbi:hypothetical protein TNCV_4018271 [Trichonephila clavipes]|nr:hypothetical protein TNCV_4018271 [Trichonephila clavipes]
MALSSCNKKSYLTQQPKSSDSLDATAQDSDQELTKLTSLAQQIHKYHMLTITKKSLASTDSLVGEYCGGIFSLRIGDITFV